MKILRKLFLLLAASVAAYGNVAAPSYGGQTLTEPGGISEINVLEEQLNLNFSNLAAAGVSDYEKFIDVEAIYLLESPKLFENLELVFVIVSEFQNFRLFLDDAEIKTTIIDNKEFAGRETWKKPEKTPYEDRELMYNPQNSQLKSTRFKLTLSPGKHRLRAVYRANPTVYKNIGVMKGWQFAYSLAPARDWKSFGKLNVKMIVPENWRSFSNLEFNKTPDGLTAQFDKLPADFLAVTLQAPIPAQYKTWTDVTFFSFIAVLIVGPLVIFGLAYVKGWKWKYGWVYGFPAGLVWSGLTGVLGYLSLTVPFYFVPQGQYASYGYDDLFSGFMIVVATFLTLIFGVVIWAGTVLIASKMKSL